jgi:hypothetical protein
MGPGMLIQSHQDTKYERRFYGFGRSTIYSWVSRSRMRDREWDLECWSKVTKMQNMRGGSTDSEGLQYIVGRLVLSIKFVFLMIFTDWRLQFLSLCNLLLNNFELKSPLKTFKYTCMHEWHHASSTFGIQCTHDISFKRKKQWMVPFKLVILSRFCIKLQSA